MTAAKARKKTPASRRRNAAVSKKATAPIDQHRADRDPEEVTLEDFLVACHKSLARSTRSAQQASKSDSEFAQGERPVYVVDGLEFTLNAGIRVLPNRHAPVGERVLLNFDAPLERRSTMKFRVDTQPTELLAGAKIELANMDSLGHDSPNARMRIWLVDDKGVPVPQYPVQVFFARAGERSPKKRIDARTDSVGRIDFFVDTLENYVKIVGDRNRYKVFLRGGGRKKVTDEYFVWAAAPRDKKWKTVVEPTAPRPPRLIRRDAQDAPLELCSELHRLRID